MLQSNVSSRAMPMAITLLMASVIAACGGGNSDSSSDAAAAEALRVSRTPAPAPAPAPTGSTNEGGVKTARTPAQAPAPSPSPAGACGVADIGGWTVPTPSARDANVALRSLQQPGSRLYYISAVTGDDATGDIYFWDGTQIIDSAGKSKDAAGVAYGTDAMNPSSAVKAFKRWAYVGPRQDGSDIGSRTNYAGGSLVATRGGFPDWWMFKRGETFDLSQDFLSFARERDPNATRVDGSLTVSGGRSAAEKQIVGAYGDVCAARPRFVHPQSGFITRFENTGFPVFKNVAYLSLHFDGHDRSVQGVNYAGLTMLYQNASATNVLFEDMWFDAATVNISENNGAQVTLRRSLITDNYTTDGTYVQGVFYSGSRDGQFRIEDSILLRNGFSHGDMKTMAWPPTGKQVWAMNGRNLYIHGQTKNMVSGMFDSVSMMGGSGDQFRAGMRVERSFFYQGYVGMGAYGGYADSEGATGSLLDNVLQRFVGTGTDSNVGQPGWGFGLTSGAYGVEVARNIVTGAQFSGTGNAFGMSPVGWICSGHVFRYATRSNNVHDNIFESPADSAPVVVQDGVTGEPTPGCSGWQFAGVKNNTVSNNVLISPSGKQNAYDAIGTAVGTTNDTAYVGNKLYASRDAAAAALGWSNPNRTLKTYMQANGVTVASPDGFPEYFDVATQQRRGQWRAEWGGKAVVNHVRGGFGVAALP